MGDRAGRTEMVAMVTMVNSTAQAHAVPTSCWTNTRAVLCDAETGQLALGVMYIDVSYDGTKGVEVGRRRLGVYLLDRLPKLCQFAVIVGWCSCERVLVGVEEWTEPGGGYGRSDCHGSEKDAKMASSESVDVREGGQS